MKYPDMDISSRGLFVVEERTNSRSLNIIEENNLPAPTPPKQLTAEDVQKAKLVVMGRSHKEAILGRWPDADVRLVSEYAGETSVDIPDPYGGTQSQYEEVFLHLKEYIEKFNW